MRILLTNDDGFSAPGLGTLWEVLDSLGHEVWVLAPLYNQSGSSMRVTGSSDVLTVRKIPGRERWYSCSGTPVDCVLLLMEGVLPVRPDAVVSGINSGSNLGNDLWYSGTVAAAREAAKSRFPGLALSCSGDWYNYSVVGDFLKLYVLDLLESCPPGSFWNINFPPDPKGVMWPEVVGKQEYEGNIVQEYSSPDGSVRLYRHRGELEKEKADLPGSDVMADRDGYITITLSSNALYVKPADPELRGKVRWPS